jgi:alpha-methylacyl-CoA racemase
MVDAAALLTTAFFGLAKLGGWRDHLESNGLDGSAPYYDVYQTADAEYVAVGAIERHFYEALLDELGILEDFPDQDDRDRWDALRDRLTEVFRTRTREEWATLAGDDRLCLSPVHSLLDAPSNIHNRYRRTYIEVGGTVQPAPAPRFSRTPCSVGSAPPLPGENTVEGLIEWGLSEEEVAGLVSTGTVRTRH